MAFLKYNFEFQTLGRERGLPQNLSLLSTMGLVKILGLRPETQKE
jgi:hypothetical protein